jgi:hypothetical protein
LVGHWLPSTCRRRLFALLAAGNGAFALRHTGVEPLSCGNKLVTALSPASAAGPLEAPNLEGSDMRLCSCALAVIQRSRKLHKVFVAHQATHDIRHGRDCEFTKRAAIWWIVAAG